jgi:hypothetical protein
MAAARGDGADQVIPQLRAHRAQLGLGVGAKVSRGVDGAQQREVGSGHCGRSLHACPPGQSGHNLSGDGLIQAGHQKVGEFTEMREARAEGRERGLGAVTAGECLPAGLIHAEHRGIGGLDPVGIGARALAQ